MPHSFINEKLQSTPLQFLKGVGEKRAKALEKMDIFTAFDLIEHYPYRYIDFTSPTPFSECQDGQTAVVCAKVVSAPLQTLIRQGLTLYKVPLMDQSGAMGNAIFFNSEYAASGLIQGKEYLLMGKVTTHAHHTELASPEYILADIPHHIKPIYRQSSGISTKIIEGLIDKLLSTLDPIEDPIPSAYRQAYNLCNLTDAFINIHHPQSMAALESARYRLSFQELLLFQLAMSKLRRGLVREQTAPLPLCNFEPFFSLLPYTLTAAQHRSINEAASDLQRPFPMNRLLQGDVGSGKTVVAAALIYMTFKAGGQSALLAPTELLASQHYRTMNAFLEPLGLHVALMTGKTSKKERTQLFEKLASNEIDLLIGTHAIFYSDQLKFANLSLAVTDEQHRFGVRQRAALAQKGGHPHILVMSATPIPRTLALILYGDLDISLLDELPAGRRRIITALRSEESRGHIYDFIKKELIAGRQAYIVCPTIEEGETDLKSVISYYEQIAKEFKGFTASLLHGKMPSAEKDRVMVEFTSGRIQLLVATTVIEVGIDQPNATIMMIENAERFGLAQLHQLRGRVGRGKHQSYCILMSDSEGERSSQRLEILKNSSDGFEIAEADLKLRGPGEFLGSRQSGAMTFKLSGLSSDVKLLKQAGELAGKLIADGADKPPISQLVEELIVDISHNGLN